MKDTRSGYKNLLVNIVFACVLLSIMFGVISLHSYAQEAGTPTPTVSPTDTPTVTPTDTPVPTVTIEPTVTPSATPDATVMPTADQGYPGPASVPGYWIYPTATPEATPVATAAVLPSPSATPTPTVAQGTSNNTTAAIVTSGSGGDGLLYSEILPLVAGTISIIVIVGCVAYYMSGKSRVQEVPKEPSHEDMYRLVIGSTYKRTRRPRS